MQYKLPPLFDLILDNLHNINCIYIHIYLLTKNTAKLHKWARWISPIDYIIIWVLTGAIIGTITCRFVCTIYYLLKGFYGVIADYIEAS